MPEADPFVRHLERDAVVACGCCAVVALAVAADGFRAAGGVLGGGLLAAVSYRALKGVIDAVAGAAPRTRVLVKFVTRHAILAAAAYVMLVRLRLHPIGMLAGASSLVLAAAAAIARSSRRTS